MEGAVLSSEILLGMDIGTGGCKAAAVNLDGELLASEACEYRTNYPAPGWAEQDPKDWLKALRAVCRKIVSSIRSGRIIGVCVDGQPHTPVFLDEGGSILYPAIPWTDRRSSAQVEKLKGRLREEDAKRTFNPLNTAFTLPQILWVKEHLPEVWKRTYKLQIAKDFVRLQLTGEGWFTDPTDALGTYLFDGVSFQWSRSICEVSGIEMEKLPEVKPSSKVLGEVSRRASKKFFLPEGVPVVNGAHDPSMENLAAGTVKPGTSFIKLATAGVISVTTKEPKPDPKGRTVTYCLPTTKDEPEGWFTKTATLSCGSSYRWFRDVFCLEEIKRAKRLGRNPFEVMDELASDAPPCSEGLVFHPYLIGEGSPYWDPRLKGDFFGIGLRHKKAHFCRAVLEGVAFSIKDSLSIFRELGLSLSEVRLIGGGSNSALWRRIVCDVLGVKGLKPLGGDSSFGSAVLAGVGVGEFNGLLDGVVRCVKAMEVVHPDPKMHEFYEKLFQVYKAVHDAMAVISAELDELLKHLPKSK